MEVRQDKPGPQHSDGGYNVETAQGQSTPDLEATRSTASYRGKGPVEGVALGTGQSRAAIRWGWS